MIRNQGMHSPRHHNFGNMYIHFTIKFPERIGPWNPSASFDALRQILPAPALENVPPVDATTEPVDIEDFDAHKAGFGSALMEEEDEDNPHAERVQTQCATQ